MKLSPSPEEIRDVRILLDLNHQEFGRLFGVGISSAEHWQVGRCQPHATVGVVLLRMHFLLFEDDLESQAALRKAIKRILKDRRSRFPAWTCAAALEAIFCPDRLADQADQVQP